MTAIANNPSFAKKVGIPQSVGKDFSAADKGKTFNKGGATMMSKKAPNAMSAMMARRRMGAGMPPPAPPVMPPQPPAPMGMKKGGKVKRYFEGGNDALEGRTDEQLNKNLDTAIKDSKTFGEAFKAARADGDKTFMWRGTSYSTAFEKPKASPATQTVKPIPSNETNAGAVTGRTFKRPAMLKTASSTAPAMKSGGSVKFAKGGMPMKESKAMVGKEMMFMKKKGAPASMIKHEKAEMGMKKGGMPMKDGKPAFMKKFAKGGGIESRGKTKGTVIRMAAGGSVSARADGIAQRGKTRC